MLHFRQSAIDHLNRAPRVTSDCALIWIRLLIGKESLESILKLYFLFGGVHVIYVSVDCRLTGAGDFYFVNNTTERRGG